MVLAIFGKVVWNIQWDIAQKMDTEIYKGNSLWIRVTAGKYSTERVVGSLYK